MSAIRKQAETTGSRYRPISFDTFAAAMAEMGFKALTKNNFEEHVYGRRIKAGPNPGRFAAVVFSSVDKRDGVTRERGADAIRVELIDTQMLDRDGRARVVMGFPRVLRTENALLNLEARIRAAREYVLDAHHHCPGCRALLVERKGKYGPFMGCTNFECKVIRPIRRCG